MVSQFRNPLDVTSWRSTKLDLRYPGVILHLRFLYIIVAFFSNLYQWRLVGYHAFRNKITPFTNIILTTTTHIPPFCCEGGERRLRFQPAQKCHFSIFRIFPRSDKFRCQLSLKKKKKKWRKSLLYAKLLEANYVSL